MITGIGLGFGLVLNKNPEVLVLVLTKLSYIRRRTTFVQLLLVSVHGARVDAA